jgi:hypothetical protein
MGKYDGEDNPFYGKRHTEETRRKMSETARHRWSQRREKKADNSYRTLIAAIVRQAIKDKAAWFFETETGKGYCALAGINPAKLHGRRTWKRKKT